MAGALRECRLEGRADAVPTALSSGQVQALQLAAMLVRPRAFMVLDEPEQRLDPEARKRLARLLLRERAAGTGILLAPHHVELARSVAEHVVVLQDGQVTAQGAPAAVLAMYLAAAQLLEPARLEAENPLRAAQLPYRFGVLALAHGALPAAILLAVGAVTVAPVAVYGDLRALASLLALTLPSTAAALASAYRGPLPPHLLVGVETPFGQFVPIQVATWYAAGPLALLAAMAPTVAAATLTAPAIAPLIGVTLWSLAATALLTVRVYRKAIALT